MNRGNLKTYCIASVPGIKSGSITTALLEQMIQLAADRVAIDLLCLKTNEKFTATINVSEYSLNTSVSNFGVIAESGLYYNQGTIASPEYKQLRPITLKWLDEHRAGWRDAGSDTPQYFYQEDDTLGVIPKPSATLANAFWLYFCQRAFQMTTDTQFPFYDTVQETRLSILDWAIVLSFKIQALGVLGQVDNYRLAEVAYRTEMDRVDGLLKRNLAIQNSRYNMFQGRRHSRYGFRA